jgi:hypothetical protein
VIVACSGRNFVQLMLLNKPAINVISSPNSWILTELAAELGPGPPWRVSSDLIGKFEQGMMIWS